jgi:sugar-specific transcriptional regulator TrmB
MDDVLHGLLEYGFSEKQAAVYLAALKLWAAPWWTIARHSGIQRATTYSILHDFIRDGVVRKITRKWLLYFSVIEPQWLLASLEKKTAAFTSILPALQGLSQTIGSKPQIQYLEWTEWLKQFFDDLMTTDTREPMRAIIGNMKYHGDKLWVVSQEYQEFRKKKKMPLHRIITQHNIDLQEIREKDLVLNRITTIVPDFPIDIKADITIYGPHKCAIMFFDDNGSAHIILIKSEDFYNLALGLFLYIQSKNTPVATSHTKTKRSLSPTKKTKPATKKK